MASAKLLLVAAIFAVLSASASAGLFDDFVSYGLKSYYNDPPTKEGYSFNFEETNGSSRQEKGIIMNPGTDNEKLVVMGAYTTYDEKTDIETTVMYTADENGYKPRTMIKNRKLSPGALKSAAG